MNAAVGCSLQLLLTLIVAETKQRNSAADDETIQAASMKLLETNVHQVGLATFDESDDVGDATKDSVAAIRSNTRLMQYLSE